jgi:hypothetical protein
MGYSGLDVNFSKALSNDFNRLGEKWANRRYGASYWSISHAPLGEADYTGL